MGPEDWPHGTVLTRPRPDSCPASARAHVDAGQDRVEARHREAADPIQEHRPAIVTTRRHGVRLAAADRARAAAACSAGPPRVRA